MTGTASAFGPVSEGYGKLIASYPPMGSREHDFSVEVRETCDGKFAVISQAGLSNTAPPWRLFETDTAAFAYASRCQAATIPLRRGGDNA